MRSKNHFLLLLIITVVACKKNNTIEVSNDDKYQIAFTTNLTRGQVISIGVKANIADSPKIWVDLNNNHIQDVGEKFEIFDGYVNYSIGNSQTITIYGKVKYLDISKGKISQLHVSKNTGLTELNCSENELTTLDVSKNTDLTFFLCHKNYLTTLDVSNNRKLATLYCDNNRLKALDVSTNTVLTFLTCHKNQLTALDVSKNIALEALWCYDNQLSSLSLSNNKALQNLYCGLNRIRQPNMDALITSLPSRSLALPVATAGVGDGDSDGNALPSETVVDIANGKNWAVYYNGWDN